MTQRSRSQARRLSRQGARWVAAAVVAAMVLVAGPVALASAQIRIGINGARPSEWPIVDSLLAGAGFTQEAWLPFALHVGENWLPATTPVAVDYPAELGILSGPGALTVDQSTEVGRQNLHATILEQLEKGEPVVVAGLSEGTLVIDREIEYLRTAADAPDADDVTFYVFGDMRRGLGEMYLRGVTIPFVGQTFEPVPESQYDTVVVNEQWDGWANPPDRPWNLLAVTNAVIGAFITLDGFNDHTHSSLANVSEAVLVSQITNALGGTTSTYLIPREQLPITRVLRQFNVPDPFVDALDTLLMPLIATGYSSMTPDLGPRIEQGRLVGTPPAIDTASARDDRPASDASDRAVGSPRVDAAVPARFTRKLMESRAAHTDDVHEVAAAHNESVTAEATPRHRQRRDTDANRRTSSADASNSSDAGTERGGTHAKAAGKRTQRPTDDR